MKNKKYGFTLIELLAVIIILSVLMVIAIPSVTNYIQTSRKNAYATTAKELIKGVSHEVNSGELEYYDPDVTYYYPGSCVTTESGGNSPFGDWRDYYVVYTYNGNGFDYYWASVDNANMGVYLTYSELIDGESVIPDVKEINPNIGVGSRSKVSVIDNGDCRSIASTIEATETIEEHGKYSGGNDSPSNVDYNNYLVLSKDKYDDFLGYNLKKETIEKIYTLKDTNVPDDTVTVNGILAEGVDVSFQKNGSIMMWCTDRDGNGMYELYIGQDGGVVANPDSSYLFHRFSKIVSIDVSNLHTEKVTSMRRMFYQTGINSTEFYLDLRKLNVSSVNDMSYMFHRAGEYSNTSFKLDLTGWNVSNVHDMSYMFDESGTNPDSYEILGLSNWNVSSVTNMEQTFAYAGQYAAIFSIDLSKWNVSNVTNMKGMFKSSGGRSDVWNIGDISGWNISKVEDVSYIFYSAGSWADTWFAGDLSKWDVSKMTNISSSFEFCGSEIEYW